MNIRETLVTVLLGDGEGFTGEGSLVDGDIDGLSETAVGGDDVTNLEGDHITGYEDRGLDLLPLGVTPDPGLGGEGVHEGLDGVTSVAFFVETDTRVDEEQENDTDEIGPIRGHALTVGEGDGDEGSSLHNPGQGIPHEREELRNF